MVDRAIIGGTGLTELSSLEIARREAVATPYGEPSAELTHGRIDGAEVVFLARHGDGHAIAPHRVNYRANIWALHSIGVQNIVAVNSVGGIREDMVPGALAFPDQLIDYTWSRAHTFHDEGQGLAMHTDFTDPYSPGLREQLIGAAADLGIEAPDRGTYAATHGPRLETAAEIDRLERDGCHMVGMTGMPEAALARELGMQYACCAVVVNRAPGRGAAGIHDEIGEQLARGMAQVRRLLEYLIPRL